MTERKKIGQRITRARRDRQWSLDELASRLDMPPFGLRCIESGQGGIGPQLLEKIAELTNKPVKYFSTGVYPGHSRPMVTYPKHL